MAIKKVLYFTVASIPTQGELDDINAIAALPGYTLGVRSAAKSADYGISTDNLEAADYVAGTPPAGYDDAEDYPVFDPGNVATPGLVDEGDTIVLTDSHGTTLNCTLVVTDGVPTLTMATTAKIIKSGVEFLAPATSGSRTDGWTPTIVAGEVTVLTGS